MSCGDLVLVCKSAEDLFPADPVLGEVDLRWPGAGLSRRELAEGAVRPGSVVVPQVLGQHPAQMVPLQITREGRTWYLAHFNAHRAVYSARAMASYLQDVNDSLQ